jgi:hypothetical protein
MSQNCGVSGSSPPTALGGVYAATETVVSGGGSNWPPV